MAPLSKEALARRTAKAKATREAKKKAALKTLGLDTKRTKVRKARKPLTEEQRLAAADRLKKAREAKGSAKYSQIAENVRNLPDEDPFSLVNVRKWLKTQKEYLSGIRSYKDSKDPAQRAAYNEATAYVSNLEAYLRSGVYLDHRAGENAESQVNMRCVAMAYHPDGSPKRTQGVWYSDLGMKYEGD